MSVLIKADVPLITGVERDKHFSDAAAKLPSRQSSLPLEFIEQMEAEKERGRRAIEAIGTARKTSLLGSYEALDRNLERGRKVIEEIDAAQQEYRIVAAK